MEWRCLRACDYGTPTTRRRLFLIARCDNEPIVWPEPTHGPGRPLPHRTAAECIDWSIPCPSIFTRKRPLAENTQRRIARGLVKYVLTSARPYIVRIGHTSSDSGKVKSIDEPLTTITSKNEHLLVAAWLAKHNGGATGQPVTSPLHTITATDTKRLMAAHITKFYGTSTGSPMDEPLPTVTASGCHLGLVAAFITKYYGEGGTASALNSPLHTIVSKARMGLVTVTLGGEEYAVVDIGMRMLQPRELARAQGFGDDYILTGTKTQQIARIGRSVPPQVITALVRANLGDMR